MYWLSRLLIVILLLSYGLSPCHADIDDPEDNLQQWSIVAIRGKIKGKVLGYIEAQPRVSLTKPAGDNPNYFNALILRPAVGYQLSKSVSLWQGYGWTPSFNPEFQNEHRPFQQLLVENKIRRLNLTNRTRLEERFIEGVDDVSVRARHMARAAFPLDKKQKWFLVGYDELFINLNDADGGPRAGLDQNRAFLGVNRKFKPNTVLELGYLNQYINRAEPSRDRMNHAIILALYITLQ